MGDWIERLLCRWHIWSPFVFFDVEHFDGFKRHYRYRECALCGKREMQITGWGAPLPSCEMRFNRSRLRDARGRFVSVSEDAPDGE